jgi:DNA-binding response OmpR family regulator
MKILLVEDNIRLAEDMIQFLAGNGFVVEHAATLQTGLEKINIYHYDMVIVDIGLPDGNGLELIKKMKSNNTDSGILIVTAKNAIEDKVHGLDLGADDYITKPFHQAELNARIRSILRRKKFKSSNILKINEIKIDIPAAQVCVNENPILLTKKEYDLLLYFMYNQNRVLTKESIAEHLWGDHIDQADSFDFIYNHIKNLRRKIINAGGKDHIKSMYGMGYKFCD